MPAAPANFTTIGARIRQARDELEHAGLEDVSDEARRLVAAALGFSAAQLVSRSSEQLQEPQEQCVAAFLARRARHEPLSRIVGVREFYGRPFKITPATLDPRPDTETLIDAVRELFKGEENRALRILDIGTGTGAIIVTLLAEFLRALGVATDIDEEALVVARENARMLGVASRAQFQRADIAANIEGPFDLVVSNPPYVRRGDIAELDASVRDYDPHLALDGGHDGLRIYGRIAAAVPLLVGDGWICLEVGFDQAGVVAELFEKALVKQSPVEIRFFKDVAGIRRVVAARARTGVQA